MALWRRLGVGLGLLGLLSAGCGRESTQLAVPAVQAIAFAPQSSATATAEGQVLDMGSVLELRLNGKGFQPGGIYSVQPLLAYRGGSPATFTRSDDAPPAPMPALSDGRVELLTTFQRRGAERAWVGMGVFFHPDHDVTDAREAQLVLFAPLPGDL